MLGRGLGVLRSEVSLSQEVVLAVGVHPSHATYNSIKELLRDPVVRARGEIGIDHSLSCDTWATQGKHLSTS